jgi:glycosyltransferase involved in cell wall biosynthesis
MKILLASTSSGSRGGGELYLLYLGKALAQRGHAVALWVSSHERMDELAAMFSTFGSVHRADYVNTYDRRGRSLAAAFDSATAARIAAKWRTAGFDCIHLNKQNLEDGLDLLQAAASCGVPGLCTVHLTQDARYLGAKFAGVRDWVAKRALKKYPGLLVAVLEDRRRDLARFLGAENRTRTIPNGVPIPDLSGRASARVEKRKALGLTDDAMVIIAVGRLVPQKRPLVFLEQAAQIHRAIPNARFVWVGDGGLSEDWDSRAAALGLKDVVQRLGWLRDVDAWLLAADVFLHVAEFEGLPLAILEAMASALPCAISMNLYSEMPFLNDRNSIAVPDGDFSWITSLKNTTRLAELGAAARRLAEEQFSFDKMAESYEALYRQALTQRR